MNLTSTRVPLLGLLLVLSLLVSVSGAFAWTENECKGIMRVELSRLTDYFQRFDVDGNGVLSFAELMAFYYEASQLPPYPNGEYTFYPGGWAKAHRNWGHYQWAWGFNNPANPNHGLNKDAVRQLLYHFRTYDLNCNDALVPEELWLAVNKLGTEVKPEHGAKPYAPDWAGHKGAGPGQGGAYPAGIEHYKMANPSYWDCLFSDPKAGLVRKDLNGLIADFYAVDLDQDYHLNPQEIERYLHPKDPEPPAFKFQLIIARKDLFQMIKDFPVIDNDRNSVLSYPELLTYFHKLPPTNRWGPWAPPWVIDPAFGIEKSDLAWLQHHGFRSADLNHDWYLSTWEFWGYVHQRYNYKRGWAYPGQSVHWGQKYPWDHPAAKGPQFVLAENDILRLHKEFEKLDTNHDGILQMAEFAEGLKQFAATYSDKANMLEVRPYTPGPGVEHYPY